MIISLCVLVLYTSTSSVTKTIVIKQPPLNIYFDLQNKYSQTLVCPCSSIANEHHKFISFQPTFHPVCHSDFITDNWFNYLKELDDVNIYWDDFRYSNSLFFQVVGSFCELSLETITNQIFVFNATKYVTKDVQQIDLFHAQVQQLIDDIIQATQNSLKLFTSMLRQTIWGNELWTFYAYNFMIVPTTQYWRSSTINNNNTSVITYPRHYAYNNQTSCSCKTQATICKSSCKIMIMDSEGVRKILHFSFYNYIFT